MADTVVFRGVADGYTAEMRFELNSEDYANEQFMAECIARLKTWGINPGSAAAKTAQAQQAQAAPQEHQAQAPLGGGCNVHGLQNAKSSKFGGFYCGASAQTQQPWTATKATTDRNGNAVWYCASKWK